MERYSRNFVALDVSYVTRTAVSVVVGVLLLVFYVHMLQVYSNSQGTVNGAVPEMTGVQH
jgi:hypothetical protein